MCVNHRLKPQAYHSRIHLPAWQAFPREVRLESWDKSKKKINDGGGGGERTLTFAQ